MAAAVDGVSTILASAVWLNVASTDVAEALSVSVRTMFRLRSTVTTG